MRHTWQRPTSTAEAHARAAGRRRWNKQRQQQAAARRRQVLVLLIAGKTRAEMAALLQVDRSTIARDLAALARQAGRAEGL